MKLFTREELIDKILQEEDLLPGDKVSLAKLNNISEKYGISPYVLATNLFEVSQHNYANLNSKNTTNVVILKRRLPEIIAKVGEGIKENILKEEDLKFGDKINYSKIKELAKKYAIREKVLALYVLEISEGSFNRVKSNQTRVTHILGRTHKNQKQNEESKEIKSLREYILKEENLKPNDRIDYLKLVQIAKKYNISEKLLAYDIFWLSKRTYSNIKYLKINAIILKNYWSKDSIENLKMMIITKENLHPFDKINYIDLSNLSKKYGIHEKVLAIDILGITETMYHTIKYHQNTFTCILKNDSLSKTQLQELRIKIFEAEKLYEGYRISYLETKVLLKKYKIKLYDLLYILGITEYSYYVIKEFQQQKAIIKDTEKALNLQILNQLLDKNRYYNYEEINHICEYYNISILDFINYVIGNAKYFGYTDYLDLLNKKGIIWIGEKCKLSSEFVKQNINELQKIALTVSKKAYAHFYNTDSINIDKDDLFQESLIFILTKCGDLEKNFEGEDLSRMIYLRTKITIFNKMRIHFRNNDFRTKDDIDLEVLGECDETLENDAFESLEKISLLEKEKINLEEIKKKLLENEMVKETVDGHYILGEEDIMKINLLLQNKTEEYH